MTVHVGFLGLGNVGGEVAKHLLERRPNGLGGVEYAGALVRDPGKYRGSFIYPQVTANADDVVSNPRISVVVELMGGTDPALAYVMKSIEAGKSIVTANKALIAEHGPEIFDAARRKEVDVLFEAAVGGSIPIIRTMKESLNANEITSVYGILNGTTNYILTRMGQGFGFHEALRDAQERGFAEPDPRDDLSGRDAAYKLSILASLAFNTRVRPEDVYFEGIASWNGKGQLVPRIIPLDIETAKLAEYDYKVGYAVKLLGIARKQGNRFEARVHPVLIHHEHPLASVNYEDNAIFVEGDLSESQIYQGKGAGKKPTASAVLADVIHAARNIETGVRDKLPSFDSDLQRIPIEEIETPLYFRLYLPDKPGTLQNIWGIFGRRSINIDTVSQKSRYKFQAGLETVQPVLLITNPASGANLNSVWKALQGSSREGSTYIRFFE